MFRNTKVLAGLFVAAGAALGWTAASDRLTPFQKAWAAPPGAAAAAEQPGPTTADGSGCCPAGAADLRLAQANALPITAARQAEDQAIVFEVVVPTDAVLMIDDDRTTATGETRVFQTPPLP